MNKILVEQSPSPMKLEVLGVEDWPLAAEPVGVIDREVDGTETSFIALGAGSICAMDDAADLASFAEGDLVTIMPETRCRWTITEAVERHYSKG